MRRGRAGFRPRLPAAIALAAGAAALAAALAAPVRSSFGAQTTGDEPHYLLTAVSLAQDGDLDVADEHAAGRYREFHETYLPPQGKLLRNRRLVAPHDPLLPFLLAVPASSWGWLGARLTTAALAGALSGLTVWIAVRRLGAAPSAALASAAVFGASAPLAVYGAQVYPEVPAALAMAGGVAAATGRLGRPGLAGVWAPVVALPWLGTKYTPAACALALVVLLRLARSGRRRAALLLAGSLAAAGAAFAGAHLAWYGGLTPYAAGAHFAASGEMSAAGERIDLLARGYRILGLLVDSTFGIAAWQPAWLLAVPVVAALVRRRPPGWDAFLLPLAAGWLTASILALTMHGWWFPGRQVVVVLPLLAAAVAGWAGGTRRRMWVLGGAGGAGVLAHLWMVAEGWRGRTTWAVNFFETSNPLAAAWRAALPDYMDPSPATWVLHALWVAAAMGAAAWSWRVAGRRGCPAPVEPLLSTGGSRPRSS